MVSSKAMYRKEENNCRPSVCAEEVIGRDDLPVCKFFRQPERALILLNMWYSQRWRSSHHEVGCNLASNCSEWVGYP